MEMDEVENKRFSSAYSYFREKSIEEVDKLLESVSCDYDLIMGHLEKLYPGDKHFILLDSIEDGDFYLRVWRFDGGKRMKMDEKVKKSLQALVDYLEEDECKHYEEEEEGPGKDSHIYHDVMVVQKFLEKKVLSKCDCGDCEESRIFLKSHEDILNEVE